MRASRLVVEGGTAAVSEGKHRAGPRLSRRARKAAIAVLDAGAGDAGGPNSRFAREFEKDLAAFCGVRHCRALSSGTDALWAALVAYGVGRGDRVIVPAVSYVATAAAVAWTGAAIDWCDVDPATGNLDTGQVRGLIGRATQAIVPVHSHGLIADMAGLEEALRGHQLAVVEDAAQAAGATQGGRLAGTFGLAAAGSLNVKKPLQGGDGGWLLTDDDELHEAVVSLVTFGEGEGARPGAGETSAHWARYLGKNSRLHPVAAAIARAELEQLPSYLDVAEENARILIEGLRDLPGLLAPHVPAGDRSTHHLFRVRVDPAALGWEGSLRELRDRVMWALLMEGVPVGTWQTEPLPRMAAFRRVGMAPRVAGRDGGPLSAWDDARFPGSRQLLDGSFVLGRAPYGLHYQSPGLMRAYVAAFRKLVERRGVVLRGAYEPLRIVPPIPADEL